jgi:plasmid replication initiation protein
MKFDNLEVIQSYILTTAKYDFSIYEKKIMYRLVQIAQADLAGKKLDKKYLIGESLFGDKKVSMKYSDVMKDGDRNHNRIKTALWALRKKDLEYYDVKSGWESIFSIIQSPKVNKLTNELEFTVNETMWQVILGISSKGWRKYELKTAMSFESIYSMRFYELVSNTKEGYIQQFTIENLKEMFGLNNKYKLTADFVRRVVEPAKVELDEKSPYSFNYKLIKAEGSRKYTSIMITTLPIPKNQDLEIEKKSLQMKSSSTWVVGKETKDYLIRNYGFDEKGIRSNTELFESAIKCFDLQKFLSENIRAANGNDKNGKKIGNKAGWLIRAIEKHLTAIEKKKTSKKSDVLISGLGDKFKV